MHEKQLHFGLQYYSFFFLAFNVYIIALQRTLTFDEDKRQVKKKKNLPLNVVPAPPVHCSLQNGVVKWFLK